MSDQANKYKGIDISKWQGNVDFKYLKENNDIDFLILREGYRKTVDEKFFEYVKSAKDVGFNIIGVYHFCYAYNEDDVIKEADSCIKNIEEAGLGKNTIIFFDFEYDTVDNAKKANIYLKKEHCIRFSDAFCSHVQSLGYRAGIYADAWYYKNMHDPNVVDKYYFWLADYDGDPCRSCLVHQYTSSGKVNGISGKVDLDYLYTDDINKLMDWPPKTETEGWKQDPENSLWFYQYSDGSIVKDGWKYLKEVTGGTYGWYLFKDGYMLTGIQEADGALFYLSESKDTTEGQCMVTNDQGELIIIPYDEENERFEI